MEHSLKALQRPKADIATEQSVQIHYMSVHCVFQRISSVFRKDRKMCVTMQMLVLPSRNLHHNKYPTLCIYNIQSNANTMSIDSEHIVLLDHQLATCVPMSEWLYKSLIECTSIFWIALIMVKQALQWIWLNILLVSLQGAIIQRCVNFYFAVISIIC